MARLALVTLLTAAAVCGAAQPPQPPPPPPAGRYKDFYHSYTLRQQVESQESFSGRGAGAGGLRGLPTGPSAPSAPAAAATATEAPPPPATPAPPPPAPDRKPTAEALTAVQVADAHERASSPVYYHAYPYYTYAGWPVVAHAVVAPAAVVPHPAWGRQAEPSARAAGVFAGLHHGGFFHHPVLFGAHHGGAIAGPHGLVSQHGGILKGPHGLAAQHNGLLKSHLGLAAHHSGLVKGHHGLVGHHGGFIKTPLGLVGKHGGGVLLHARDATGSQPEPEPAEGQPMAQQQQQAPLYTARSAVPHQLGGYHVLQPRLLGWKAPGHGHGQKGYGAAVAAVPAVPGKIKGGADVALFNAHGHGSHKGLQGATAHKYKHFNLDAGFGCARPLHLVHTDAGYDVSQYSVGGAASAAANVAHGLGGNFGLL